MKKMMMILYCGDWVNFRISIRVLRCFIMMVLFAPRRGILTKRRMEKRTWEIFGNRHMAVENIGIEPSVKLRCRKCKKTNEMEYERSRFYGLNYRGNHHLAENCSWYSSNWRLVLATLGTVLGPSDVPSLSSFLGLPHLQSFSKCQFFRIEPLMWKFLKVIDKNLYTDHNNILELTVGYDMGWSKRSSGKRYNSLSGHAFLTGCHSTKILGAQITSKKCSALFLKSKGELGDGWSRLPL